MPQPYVGEIRMFAGTFAPRGWMFCDGTPLPIAENEVLYQLIGTTYGGDGQETFVLPNLQSRIPIHAGTGPDNTNYQLAEMAGTESETLTTQQMPVHNHTFVASSSPGNVSTPEGNLIARSTTRTPFAPAISPPAANLNALSMATSGGNQPHENTQPFLCINFIISLFGIFPSQT